MDFVALEKWKLLLIAAGLQLISFACGLYSGHTYWPKQQIEAIPINYNTQTPPTTNAITKGQGTNANTPTNQNCPVKGNVSGKNRIYHVQGGAFYERTQEEMCFKTEAEATAAGFVKSSR